MGRHGPTGLNRHHDILPNPRTRVCNSRAQYTRPYTRNYLLQRGDAAISNLATMVHWSYLHHDPLVARSNISSSFHTSVHLPLPLPSHCFATAPPGMRIAFTILPLCWGGTEKLRAVREQVVLSKVGNDAMSTYINANYIPGPDGETRKYIAAMGPKTNTLGHFWRMIWENKVQAIVMTTNTVENRKDKCAVCVDNHVLRNQLHYACTHHPVTLHPLTFCAPGRGATLGLVLQLLASDGGTGVLCDARRNQC